MGEDDSSQFMKDNLFPYPALRQVQMALISEINRALDEKGNLIVHAPTGLGKTAATIAPALKYAIDNNKKVFFLTSRHTQHLIAIETLKEIKKMHGEGFVSVDLIGKRWLCSVPGIEALQSSEFYDFCEKQVEEKKCEFYLNTKDSNKLTHESFICMERLKKESPCHVERLKEVCSDYDLCSYEITTALAKSATVIVTDYYYIYNERIRNAFFKRAQIDLEDCIVIVDEGHNLPDRIRNLMTVQLSNYMLKRAISEAGKIHDEELEKNLAQLRDLLNDMSKELKDGEEIPVQRNDFINKMEVVGDYEIFIEKLQSAAKDVREKEKRSSLGAIAGFLDAWVGADLGYARILSQKSTKRDSLISLSYRCLDPGIVTKQIIKDCHSTIIMSGTLTPTEMYKDILGFPEETVERRYRSPFPDENRLALVVPETTTKFSMRTDQMYEKIAKYCSDITNIVPGNSSIFFPSYYMRDQVYKFFNEDSKKTAFLEHPDMSREEKAEFLERFKSYKDTGAVLLGVVSGSYGEGVDLPGDLLKCVIVVGLPLQQPSLETKELIKYYDAKFGKGWDYGYVAPAFSKCLQSAGRCIRSETDKGVVVFLDERYAWQNYFRHFPRDMEIQVTKDHKEKISEFFNSS